MKRLTGIVLLLLLLSAAAPVLACMTGSAMTHEESACCAAMHGDCGQMAKMGCCRTETQSDEHPQTAAKAPSVGLDWAVVDWPAAPVFAVEACSFARFDIPADHSPPGLLTAKTTVLRI